MEARQLTSQEAIARFILTPKIETGSATFTISQGAERFTYKVNYRDGEDSWNRKPIYFVKVLTGPDNSSNYTYLGYLQDEGRTWRHDKKNRISPQADSARYFRALIRKVFIEKAELPAGVEFRHTGRCGRCGRTLTVPESLDTGFGPECAGKVGADWGRKVDGALETILGKDQLEETRRKGLASRSHPEEIVTSRFPEVLDDEETEISLVPYGVLQSQVDTSRDDIPVDDLEDVEELFSSRPKSKRSKAEILLRLKAEKAAAKGLARDIYFDERKPEASVTDGMSNSEFAKFLE